MPTGGKRTVASRFDPPTSTGSPSFPIVHLGSAQQFADAATGHDLSKGAARNQDFETSKGKVEHDDAAGLGSGAVYVFTRQGTTWSRQEKFTAEDSLSRDRFAKSMALPGSTLLVGASGDWAPASAGAACVFEPVDVDDDGVLDTLHPGQLAGHSFWTGVACLVPRQG